jgi:hypothetical protein
MQNSIRASQKTCYVSAAKTNRLMFSEIVAVYCENHKKTRTHIYALGARGRVVVEALRYKPEGSRFETRYGQLIFSVHTLYEIRIMPGIPINNQSMYKVLLISMLV